MPEILAQRDPRQLRRDIRGIILCLVGFYVAMVVVMIIVMVIAAMIGMLRDPEMLALISSTLANSSSPGYPNQYFDSQADYFTRAVTEYATLGQAIGMICALPLFLLIRKKQFFSSDIIKVNHKAKLGPLLMLLVLVFGVQGIMLVLQMILEPLVNAGGSSLTDSLDETMTNIALTPFGALFIAGIGPVLEEMVFRGAIMRHLERYGANFAIVVSAMLFGIYHLVLFQSIFAFLLGLLLAYTAGRFSLKWAVLLHALNNSIAVILIYADNMAVNIAVSMFFLVAMIAAIIIVVVKRQLLKAQRLAGAPSEMRVFARSFASPWMISFIVLAGLIMFMPFVGALLPTGF